MTNFKNISKTLTFILLIIINLINITYLSIIVYNIILNSDLQKYNFTFITILITSIATGSFFLIRIYIENQLGIKEKEMIKEYQDSLALQSKEHKEQIDEQNIKLDKRFNKIEKDQENLIFTINKLNEYLKTIIKK